MIASLKSPGFTPQEYFDWEELQQERHEYFDGEVYAMAGGSLVHGRIGLNVGSLLQSHVSGSGCITYNSDCKLGISEKGPFTYPDVSVSCDDRDGTAQQFIQFPCLIIEVLSPSTEAYDRGGKFKLYRRLTSLQEYVLVSSETQSVEIFRRRLADTWEFTAYGEGDRVIFESIGLTVDVEAFYQNVALVKLPPIEPE
jgi:Uma2 family endonuclease